MGQKIGEQQIFGTKEAPAKKVILMISNRKKH